MKILYLVHVPWHWIFQRPQILALQLEKDFDCTVVCRRVLFRKITAQHDAMPQKAVWANLIPGSGKSSLIKKIDRWIYKRVVEKHIDCDAIWVCHPEVSLAIPEEYAGKIIYDCMDHHVAMVPEAERQELYEVEQRLIKRADLVLVSSKKLYEVVPNVQAAKLVRNGYRKSTVLPVKEPMTKATYTLGYFGTISAWFDLQTIWESIEKNSNIQYHLLGPIENGINLHPVMTDSTDIIRKAIIYDGVIEHGQLGAHVADYDALVMPFVVNDITAAVDPVKLYEYIAFGKCIISIWYPEIDRFEPYVYFYRTKEEYIELLESLSKQGFPAKYNTTQQKEFLQENSWEQRCEIIRQALLELEEA